MTRLLLASMVGPAQGYVMCFPAVDERPVTTGLTLAFVADVIAAVKSVDSSNDISSLECVRECTTFEVESTVVVPPIVRKRAANLPSWCDFFSSHLTQLFQANEEPMVIPPAPFSSYGTLTGQLFLYGYGRVAFESPLERSSDLAPNKLLLIGGLSDGLLPVPYTQLLDDMCRELGDWSLVQPILSSSFTGFGHGSLKRDCDEIQECINFLIQHRGATGNFAIVGHSTGCQDAVYFMKYAPDELRGRVRLIALQGSVSDREDAEESRENLPEMLALANKIRDEGNEQEMMPREAMWAPITASRFLDLFEKGGTDDFFSSDFTSEELKDRLGHLAQQKKPFKVLLAFSILDEFVPAKVDKLDLVTRFTNAIANEDVDNIEALLFANGNHNLSETPSEREAFVEKIKKLLRGVLITPQ